MIKMNILLKELKKGRCDSLYQYDQFITNKFFEYAINDNEYILNLDNISGFENMKQYNIKHEHLIIVACKASMNKKNIHCYKIFYKKYLDFKSKFMAWRGRYDWFYFHKLLFSHFIWHNDINTLLWTWNKKMEYCKNFKKKYTMVSDWRRKWYMNEIKNLRCYIIEVCIFSDKIDLVKVLVNEKILKINKYIKDIFIQYGYKCNKEGIVSKAEFYHSPEWQYICYVEQNISNVDLRKCISICDKSNCSKCRIYELLKKQNCEDFWTFFKDIQAPELKIITSKYLTNLLKLSKDKYFISNKELQNEITMKLFTLFDTIKPCLIFAVYDCMDANYIKNSDLNINVIYNFVYNFIKSNNKHIQYYTNLKLLCNLFIRELNLIITNENDDLTFSDTNILYNIFGNRISNLVRQKIGNIKKTETTDVCPICLENINTIEECVLFCGHRYHKMCINKDLKSYYTNNIPIYKCPICRCNYNRDLITIFL